MAKKKDKIEFVPSSGGYGR